LRRVSSALNQARLAFDKRLAKRAALLIVEFNLQTTIPAEGVAAHVCGFKQNSFSQCFVSNNGTNDLTGSGSLTVIVVCSTCSGAAVDRIVRTKSAKAPGPSVKASHASTPRRA
jgi:hypothetical protein